MKGGKEHENGKNALYRFKSVKGLKRKRRYKRMNKTMMGVILATLICITMVAPAMAQPSPFVITGQVSDSNGDPCNNPWVQVTNVNTSASWDAENSSISNDYQLVLDSGDVSEGDVLEIEASGCSQSKIVSETVSQDEINGGGFSKDVTLEGAAPNPVITSCDADGNEKNEFYPGDNVSVTGTGLALNTNYTILIQPDPVGEGDELNTSIDPSGAQETVKTGADGSFGRIVIWSAIHAGSQMDYDIVVDKQDDGANTGKYNAVSDGIDAASTEVGFTAPIPELATIALFAVGLVMLLGYMRLGRRD